MPASLQIKFAAEELVLLADRALHWPSRKTLVVADIHLGKDASFRAAGLPVPAGNSQKDLARIAALLSVTKAERLVILGDLVHSRSSHQPELSAAFSRWRAAHQSLDVLLVRGNHDRHAGPSPADWNITQVPELFDDGPFTYAHKPQPHDRPLLCGHVHPTATVRDYGSSFATIPCFVADPQQLIFPSFGSFTGGYRMGPEPRRSIYLVTGKSVVKMPESKSIGTGTQ